MMSPQLDWMQVDTSSHAPGTGEFSMRHLFPETWRERHMEPEVMLRVAPYLHRVKMVHFQGWGEPMANPDFFQLAAIARKAGCRLTTAAHDPAFMREAAMEKLVSMGFASITVNVASLDEELHYKRRGTDLAQIRRRLKELAAVKQEYCSDVPRVLALYSLFRSSMVELEALPAFFAPLGVRTLLVNPLAAVPFREQLDETVVPRSQEEFDELCRRLETVGAEAAKRGMGFHYFLLHGGKSRVRCIENVQRALFLGAEGDVSPCVFSQIPADMAAEYHFQGMALPLSRMVFGNVRRQLLRHVWHQPQYREFRKASGAGSLPPQCVQCWRPYIVAM